MASYDDKELRLAAYRLVARAESDPEFAQRVKDETAVVLREAGLPEDAVEGGVRQEQMMSYDCCADFTCWTSDCPCSCYVSFHSKVFN